MDKVFEIKEYDYITRKRAIDELVRRYPIIKKNIIGTSCAGREIPALQIGSAKEYSLICAAFHGSERITSLISLMFLEELCKAIMRCGEIAEINARKALFGRGLIVVPCVNPDGCEISLKGKSACGGFAEKINKICKGDFEHWNANLRGVDINHNFSAGWKVLKNAELKNGICGPAKTRYGGSKPESEPETIALTELCRTVRMRQVLALHSQGEVIYWSYGDKNPYRSRQMAEIMATSSGYALDYPTGLAVGGGFKDWFIEEFKKPGFTAEIGMGENPLPIGEAHDIYETVREMLMLFTIM